MLRPSSASGCQSRDQERIQKEPMKQQNPYKLPIGTKNIIKQSNSIQQKMEWEKLYEESIQLKSIANQLKEENIKLRTKNTTLEKDLQKCTNIFEEMEQTGNMKRFYSKPSTDNQMILNLKAQVKQLNEQLNDSNQELINIKKSTKYTKLTELEIECKQFQDETKRLTQIIESLFSENMSQRQNETDTNKLREILQQREQLIKQMQEELEYYIEENKALSEKLQQMVQAYQELDKIYGKYQNEAKNKMKIKERQIQDLRSDMDKISTQSKPTKQVTIKKPNNSKFMDRSINSSTKRENSFKINNTNNNNSNNQHHNNTNNLNISLNRQVLDLIEEPVKLQDLEEIRLELRLRLTAAQISTTKIDKYLFIQNKTHMDYSQLHDKLTKQPFLLDKPDAMLLARYLIEKHNQTYPYNSHLNLNQSNQFIKSTFINIIGYWPIYDQIESKILERNISKVLKSIIDILEQKLQGQTYNYKDLQKLFDQLLNQKNQNLLRKLEYEYLLHNIIKECQNIRKLNGSIIIKQIKEFFENEDNQDNQEENNLEELEQYYNRIQKRNCFFYKQTKLKREQILALFSDEEQFLQTGCGEEKAADKSTQQYLLKNCLIRSYSEPDILDLQYSSEMYDQQDDDDQEYENQNQNTQQNDDNEEQQQEYEQGYEQDEFYNQDFTESEQQGKVKQTNQSDEYQEDNFENDIALDDDD